jgi:hypothetical protein
MRQHSAAHKVPEKVKVCCSHRGDELFTYKMTVNVEQVCSLPAILKEVVKILDLLAHLVD